MQVFVSIRTSANQVQVVIRVVKQPVDTSFND